MMAATREDMSIGMKKTSIGVADIIKRLLFFVAVYSSATKFYFLCIIYVHDAQHDYPSACCIAPSPCHRRMSPSSP